MPSKYINIKIPVKFHQIYILIIFCPMFIDRTTGIKMLYVFVDIKIDPHHFIDTIHMNFIEGTILAGIFFSKYYFFLLSS